MTAPPTAREVAEVIRDHRWRPHSRRCACMAYVVDAEVHVDHVAQQIAATLDPGAAPAGGRHRADRRPLF